MDFLNRDALARLSYKVDDATLSSLIEQFSDSEDEYGWYLRVRQLAKIDIPFLEGDWKSAYERLPRYLGKQFGLRTAINAGEDGLIIRILLSQPNVSTQDTLTGAVLVGDPNVVRILLERVDPTSNNNAALRLIAPHNLELAEILLADNRVRQSLTEEMEKFVASRLSWVRTAISNSISKGYVHVLELLSKASSLTVTNSDLLLAVQSGNDQSVGLVLSSGQLDLRDAGSWLVEPLSKKSVSMFDVVSKYVDVNFLILELREAIVQANEPLVQSIVHDKRVRDVIGDRAIGAYLAARVTTESTSYPAFLQALILDRLSPLQGLNWLIDRWISEAQRAAVVFLDGGAVSNELEEAYLGYFICLSVGLSMSETVDLMREEDYSDEGIALASKLIGAQLGEEGSEEYGELTYDLAVREMLGL